MNNYLISLNDIPADGKMFELDDPAIWREPLKTFIADCRVSSPLSVRLHVMLMENGCLARGTITGEVILACNRCAEDTVVAIKADFEDFKEFPEQDIAPPTGITKPENCVEIVNTVPMLDMAAVCWEEFVLALPSTPLCSKACKGLCASCGVNLNTESCTCHSDVGDPRLSALRGLVLHKS